MKPFGDFAADRFLSTRPELRRLYSSIADAAFVYLIRFDKFLTTDFVHETFAALSRRLADAIGISPDESRRVFLRSFHDSAADYFSTDWDDVDVFVRVNSASLLAVRRRQAKTLDILLHGLGPNENAVRHVDGLSLDVLLSQARPDFPLLVKVYADYCSVCRELAHEFESAARTLYTRATFASLNGPKNPEVSEMLNVTMYPTVLRFSDADAAPAVSSPSRSQTAQDIIAFALSHENQTSKTISVPSHVDSRVPSDVVSANAAALSAEHDPDPAGSLLGQWAGMLRRQGIDELEALVHDRDVAIHAKIDNALRCNHMHCRVQAQTPMLNDQVDRPFAILLGGGMGSGKSSVVRELSRTEFWKERGDSVVVVEADAFKQTDPMFTALASIGAEASHVVHPKSLEGADSLLLLATEARRDVVFDGTMAWKPFIDQTIHMLRDTDYHYKRGPGYVRDAAGNVSETYWIRTDKRKFTVKPYWIEVVGVTVDPILAVQRAIIRTLVTGRGVPVRKQLASHQRFSIHFEEYAEEVDAVYLFDMSTSSPSSSTSSASVRNGIIASKSGLLFPGCASASEDKSPVTDKTLVIENRSAFEQFRRRRGINVSATNASELYCDAVQISNGS